MRKFEVLPDEQGCPRLSLNGEPLFHSGLLDQGYWSDGLYTPPSDEAMAWEIAELKKLGFNLLRKHIKIEPLRWYYHCDRLGMLVWQDLVNGGGPYKSAVTLALPQLGIGLKDSRYGLFGRKDPDGRRIFLGDLAETAELLANVVSLEAWTIFNEGWGQFDSLELTEKLRALDPGRLIDHASGWYDQGGGDFYSRHVYFRPYRFRMDRLHGSGAKPRRRVPALTEFGGYSCPCPGHMTADRVYGYRKFADPQSLSRAFEELYRKEILPAAEKGLSVCIYTQVSDVEDEINGIFTWDREITKLDPEMLKRINDELYRA
jgi:hypothetical protein